MRRAGAGPEPLGAAALLFRGAAPPGRRTGGAEGGGRPGRSAAHTYLSAALLAAGAGAVPAPPARGEGRGAASRRRPDPRAGGALRSRRRRRGGDKGGWKAAGEEGAVCGRGRYGERRPSGAGAAAALGSVPGAGVRGRGRGGAPCRQYSRVPPAQNLPWPRWRPRKSGSDARLSLAYGTHCPAGGDGAAAWWGGVPSPAAFPPAESPSPPRGAHPDRRAEARAAAEPVRERAEGGGESGGTLARRTEPAAGGGIYPGPARRRHALRLGPERELAPPGYPSAAASRDYIPSWGRRRRRAGGTRLDEARAHVIARCARDLGAGGTLSRAAPQDVPASRIAAPEPRPHRGRAAARGGRGDRG